MHFKSKVLVTLKPEVKDSKAQVLEQIILRKEYAQSPKCHVGQYFEISLESVNEEEAKIQTEKIAREILANTVIEQFEILSLERV